MRLPPSTRFFLAVFGGVERTPLHYAAGVWMFVRVSCAIFTHTNHAYDVNVPPKYDVVTIV